MDAGHGPPVIESTARPALVTDGCRPSVDDVNPPPADIRTEERDVASARDEGLDTIAHRAVPIFVVPVVQQQPIAPDQRRVGLQIEIGAEVDAVAISREPANEWRIPMREASGLTGAANCMNGDGRRISK